MVHLNVMCSLSNARVLSTFQSKRMRHLPLDFRFFVESKCRAGVEKRLVLRRDAVKLTSFFGNEQLLVLEERVFLLQVCKSSV